jgi:hypothetical protein
MKKLLCLFAVACSISVSAQLIDKNDIIISAGGGIGLYKYQFTDLTNNSVSPRDTSGAWVFPFQVEYGINRWLGAGLNFTYNNYIEGDSATNESARTIDFAPSVNLHVPWNLNKFDLTANIGYGYSNFRYNVNDSNGGVAKAGGTVFFFGVNPRLYFKTDGHLGIHAWYRFVSYNYKKGEVTDNANNKYEFKLDGPGQTFGFGLFYRI